MRKLCVRRLVVVLMLVFASALAAAQPYVKILSPQPEQAVPGPDVTVEFQAGGMHFAPCGGSVHFMLDNEPFEVQFDPSHPHVFRDVAPGTHTIRAYCADAMHKAVEGSLDMVTFSVAYPDEENRHEHGEPMLTYNLPQGEYRGVDAMDITLNFLVSGTALSQRGFHVNYYVDGKRYIVYDCMSRNLKGLAPGFHSVRVDLVDEKGRVVGGPFASVERVILLSPEKDPLRLKPGEAPPNQPVITSIHGAATMGLPTVAMNERPTKKTPDRPKTISVASAAKKTAPAPATIEIRDAAEKSDDNSSKDADTKDTGKMSDDEESSSDDKEESKHDEPASSGNEMSDMPGEAARAASPRLRQKTIAPQLEEPVSVKVEPSGEAKVEKPAAEKEAPAAKEASAPAKTKTNDAQPTMTGVRMEPATTTSAVIRRVPIRNGYRTTPNVAQTTSTKKPVSEVALYHR